MGGKNSLAWSGFGARDEKPDEPQVARPWKDAKRWSGNEYQQRRGRPLRRPQLSRRAHSKAARTRREGREVKCCLPRSQESLR